MVDSSAPEHGVRARILSAAEALIAEGGVDAATTRAVAARAGVQPPTIYRLFGDKRGLLDAVVEAAMAAYVADKAARPPDPDPVEDLRAGWRAHIAFGLARPGLSALMSADLRFESPAVDAGHAILRARVHRLALAGRLAVSEPRAVALLEAAGTGAVLSLLRTPPEARDPGLADAAFDAMLAALTGEAGGSPAAGPRAAAVTLGAALDGLSALTPGERHLMRELLDRIAGD